MVVDNFPLTPGCSLYTNRVWQDCCWYEDIGELMDSFFFEEDIKESILAVAADSSTSSQHLATIPLPNNFSSTNQHLEALNQCVQNMTPTLEFLPERSVHTNIAVTEATAKRSRCNRTGPRRNKANARERQRMHGLNGALDNLRRRAPIVSESQKLSKIETLRITRNYIQLLSGMLNDNNGGPSAAISSSTDTATILTRGMSQATTNVIHSLLGVNNRPSISFVPPPMRRDSDINIQNNNGLSHTRQQQSAYKLNDLLYNFYNAENPVDSTQNVIQTDLGSGPYVQEQTLSLDDTCWTPSEMWDSSSFDFDEPSIDF